MGVEWGGEIWLWVLVLCGRTPLIPLFRKGGEMMVDDNEVRSEIKKLTLTTQDIAKKVDKLVETNDTRNLEEKIYIEDLKANYERQLQQYKTDCDLHLQKYKADCDLHLQKYKVECKIQNTEYAETFRSVILTGQTAIRSLIIINGGAAVALLAFIGNIWVKNQPAIKGLAVSLLCFVLGVLGGGIVSALTYLGQHDYGVEKKRRGDIIRNIIIVIAICSYALFACGTYKAYQVFSTHSSYDKIERIEKPEEIKQKADESSKTKTNP